MRLGGLFFECSKKNEKCVANGTNCPFMALTDTKFSGNEAKAAGGAIFAGYIEAIRFDCSNTLTDIGLEFYKAAKWKTLKRLESEADLCPSWKGNRGDVYGADVGTYAYSAIMTIAESKGSVCVSGGKNCVIEGHHTEEDLPKAEVKLLDAFGKGPARNYRTVNANMSSVRGKFMVGSVSLPMEEGTCAFRTIKGFVPPGEYKLTVDFGEKAIKDIRITVIVRNCSVGEAVSSGGICVDCSITTFNFFPSAIGCQPCPENGNCTTRVITPNDGYWQKTPCSDQLYRCLPVSACKYKGRSEKLTDIVSDVASCHFNETWIDEDYARAQCVEVHILLLSLRIE